MTLLNQSVQVYGQIPLLLQKMREGQAPEKFTRELLRDIGFKSSNHHAFIPLLKGLGLLTADGTPTARYKEFLDSTRWKKVLAEAIKEAYSDIFVIKSKPTKADKQLIAGKYKSTYNLSEIGAERAAATFLALLELADEETLYTKSPSASGVSEPKVTESPHIEPPIPPAIVKGEPESKHSVGLHYNIQIHLPATKDVEVYNSIFKALREHLLD